MSATRRQSIPCNPIPTDNRKRLGYRQQKPSVNLISARKTAWARDTYSQILTIRPAVDIADSAHQREKKRGIMVNYFSGVAFWLGISFH